MKSDSAEAGCHGRGTTLRAGRCGSTAEGEGCVATASVSWMTSAAPLSSEAAEKEAGTAGPKSPEGMQTSQLVQDQTVCCNRGINELHASTAAGGRTGNLLIACVCTKG
jgi:hypothetical protein